MTKQSKQEVSKVTIWRVMKGTTPKVLDSLE